MTNNLNYTFNKMTANEIASKIIEKEEAYMDILYNECNPTAASNVGYMYQRGIGVARSYEKAMTFYKAASYEDGGVGFFNLALMQSFAEDV